MPDFSLLQQPSFASAALGGYQAGQALGRQKRVDAALGGVDLSRPETIVPVLQVDPQTGAQLMQAAAGVRKQADTARAREIVPAAVGGDKVAINELWGLDADLAGKLTSEQAKHVDAGVKAAGQSALQLLALPEAQRAGAWDAAIDALDETYPGLAQYKGQYSPTNLRAVLSQAGLGKEAVDLTAPRYQALVPGGTLGQTNPYAGPVFDGGATAEGGDPVSRPAPTGRTFSPSVQPIVAGNLPTDIRYRVKNKDGSISTVRTMSIGVDGGEVLIPTVVNGKILSDREAIAYYEKTGENFGTFKTPEQATAYAEQLHNYHAQLLQPSAGRTTGGWTPRARNGGDNDDAAVDGKISGMTRALGLSATDPFPSNMSDMDIARALTLSEGGKGSLADRNNNPGNLRDPSTGEYRKFASADEGLAAAARQVARNRARGQNTIATMVEGLPAGAARDGLQAPRVGTERAGAGGVKYRFKGGNPASKDAWERVG